MKENADRAISIVIGFEGGDKYTNDPDDPGGETRYGISKRYNPDVDVKNLTLEEAKAIYYQKYWLQADCDSLPSPLDIFVMDATVNIGLGGARGILARSGMDPCRFLLHRIAYYCERAQKSENAKKYFRGWVNRTIKLFIMLG